MSAERVTFRLIAIAGMLCVIGGSAWALRVLIAGREANTVHINSRLQAPIGIAGGNAVPLTVAAAPPNDPKLDAWSITIRKKLSKGDSVTPDDKASLQKLVGETNLSCDGLMTFALSVRRYCKENDVAAIMFAEVVRRGDRELAAYAPGSLGAEPILLEMSQTQNTLWRMADDANRVYVDTLLVLFNDEIKWIAPTDSDMQLNLYKAYNGRAECLMLRGELSDALAASQSIPDAVVITDAEKGSRAYGRSLILMQMGRDVEAIDYLKVAAHVGDRQQTAQRILVDELCKLGRGSEAKDAYVDFVQRFHPPTDQTQQYREKVLIALADELNGKSNSQSR